MKDPTRNIHYMGLRCLAGGGRQFYFSVDEESPAAEPVIVAVPASLFEGPERILFQEAAGICRTRLIRAVEWGTSSPPSNIITLTTADVAACRTMG
jgi:hypothetical protein